MKIEFKSLDEKIVGKPVKGKINLRATINIDTESGIISIYDERKKIQFNFKNEKLAKKWADAVG